jgi:hypothetical protein
MVKIERLADDRRVKQRYTGGIQPHYQENIGKGPALIAGLFFTLQEDAQLVGSSRSIWGGTKGKPDSISPSETDCADTVLDREAHRYQYSTCRAKEG